MKTRFSNRILAAFAVASAALILVPIGARSQQEQAPSTATAPVPVTEGPVTAATGGGELQKVTVTGYLIPRIGEGTQPVTTLDQDFISKQADQTVSDVLTKFPENVAIFSPLQTTG